jgi:WD40 repeat protein
MQSGDAQPPVLEYAPPEGRLRRALRRVPKPSGWTLILAVLAGFAVGWVWTDHGVWGASAKFPKGGGSGRLSPDGKRLIVGFDAPFQIYDVPGGRVAHTFGEPGEKIASMKFSPDGSRLATNCGPHPTLIDHPRGSGAGGGEVRIRMGQTDVGFLRLRDAATGKVLGHYVQLDPQGPSPYPTFSPDSRRLVITEQDRAMLYDAATGAALAMLAERDGEEVVGFPFFSPDSRVVAVNIGLRGRVVFRAAADGAPLAEYRVPQEPDLTRAGLINAAFSPDGATFAFQVADQLHLIDPSTGAPRRPPIALDERTWGIGFAPDGKRLLVHTQGARAVMRLIAIDPATGDTVARTPLSSFIGWGIPFQFSPDGRRLILQDSGETLLFDAATLAPLAGPTAPGRRGRGAKATFSPDLTRALTIVAPGRVEVLETSTWRPVSAVDVPLPAPRRQVVDTAFVGDADHVLTSTNGDLTLWRRRRPEAEWGIIALPQCWLAIILTAAFATSAARDVLRFYSPAPETPPSPNAALPHTTA